MAVWSSITTSKLEGAFRLDAEFWRPEFLAAERSIKKRSYVSLGEIGVIRKGVFNILADSYVESGIPFYRSSNVGNIVPKTIATAFITPERHEEESKTALRRGDLMLAKTGNPAACIVLDKVCNVSQDVIAVKLDRSQINPFYAAVFLNTSLGISQMRRWFQGQVQMHLSLPDARQILIPIPSDYIQQQVEQLVLKAEEQATEARIAISAAEASLLKWLDLEGSPKRRLHYSRPLSDMLAAGRFDAEFFSPRLQRAVEQLSKAGTTIGDVALLSSRRFKPIPANRFNYIEIGSVTADGQASDDLIEAENAPSRATQLVMAGDVITSTVRPIRRLSAIVRPDQDGYVCSSGFAVLSAKEMEAEVLLAYLRLPIFCELMDLYTTATMYPAIPVEKLMELPCPIPPNSVRRVVAKQVQAGINARRAAARSLADAKDIVEASGPR